MPRETIEGDPDLVEGLMQRMLGVKAVPIVVMPGEYGNKYIPLGGNDGRGLQNREIDTSHVKYLLGVWTDLQGSIIHLLERAPAVDNYEAVYKILDGHHRLYGTDSVNGPSMFLAIIWKWGVHLYTVQELRALYNHLNSTRVKPQNFDDILHSESNFSPWPAVFEKYDLRPKYSKGSWTPFSWSSIIKGRLIADAIKAGVGDGADLLEISASTPSIKRANKDGVVIPMQLWLEADNSVIDMTAQACAKWWPIGKDFHKTPHLTAFAATTFAAILFGMFEDRGVDNVELFKALPRITTSLSPKQREGFRGISTYGRFAKFIQAVLWGMNYRRHENNHIVFYGKRGRPPEAK